MLRSWCFFTIILAMSGVAFAFDEELQLDEENVDLINSFLNIFTNEPLTGYGTGGYGDPQTANFNLQVCDRRRGSAECNAGYPDSSPLEWRYVKFIGWRKFTPEGAAQKDWKDFKRTLRWPFSRTQTFGYNW